MGSISTLSAPKGPVFSPRRYCFGHTRERVIAQTVGVCRVQIKWSVLRGVSCGALVQNAESKQLVVGPNCGV